MTTYRVTGSTSFAGHKPGEEFEAELDKAQEQRALERGSIEVVAKVKAKSKKEEEGDA
jgi:hypothetical protein